MQESTNISSPYTMLGEATVEVRVRNAQLRVALVGAMVVIALAAGVFFRFANLDKKFFWHDESYTPLRAVGYTAAEVIDQLFDGHEIGVQDIRRYLQISPDKTAQDTISSLAAEDQEHPPFYFLVSRLWMRLVGDTPFDLRLLSVLFSLLVFPCIFWLCMELFKSRLTALIAVVLVSVSPVHVLYAQEARQYALWTVMILLSSTLLLRAARLKTPLSWVLYFLATVLGLYTHLFFVFVLPGHGLYMLVIEKLRPNRTLISFVLAALAAAVAFIPWIMVVITNYQRLVTTNSWASNSVDLDYLSRYWILNLGYPFIDVDFGYDSWLTYLVRWPAIILIGFALYYLFRTTPRQVWLFVVTLIGVTAAAYLVPDLLTGGVRSTVSRYLFPCFIGIELAVAYALSGLLTSARMWSRWTGRAVAATAVVVGVVSCTISMGADTWWTKTVSPELPQVARAVNASEHPLLIVSNPWPTNIGDAFSLSYMLDPKVRLELVQDASAPVIPDGFSDVFLFNPTDVLWAQIETDQHYQIDMTIPYSLWRAHK
ncbi:MAG: glycosyltransferase family 39 protein [Chloroflexota bacterium]